MKRTGALVLLAVLAYLLLRLLWASDPIGVGLGPGGQGGAEPDLEAAAALLEMGEEPAGTGQPGRASLAGSAAVRGLPAGLASPTRMSLTPGTSAASEGLQGAASTGPVDAHSGTRPSALGGAPSGPSAGRVAEVRLPGAFTPVAAATPGPGSGQPDGSQDGTATALPAGAIISRTPAVAEVTVSVPLSSPQPSVAPTPAPTSSVPRSGVVSADPAGAWVTSTSSSATYYCSSDYVSRWQAWAEGNRIWFETESDLLDAYPGRTRAEPPATVAATATVVVPTRTASPTVSLPTHTPLPTVSPPTQTPSPTMSPPTQAPSPTITPTPTSSIPAGGTVSPEPAGEWVTSMDASTRYYTSRDNETRWREWSEGNRIWFATEAELLSAYPGRTFAPPPPTATPKPTATSAPTSTSAPSPTPTVPATATAEPTQTATAVAPTAVPATPTPSNQGVVSPDPAGEWVTSTSASVRYYCAQSSPYWQSWSPSNRIWFASEDFLLDAYPGRVKW